MDKLLSLHTIRYESEPGGKGHRKVKREVQPLAVLRSNVLAVAGGKLPSLFLRGGDTVDITTQDVPLVIAELAAAAAEDPLGRIMEVFTKLAPLIFPQLSQPLLPPTRQ